MSSNQVIIERDMYCPYCKNNSAVIISETIKSKKLFGCAPIGLKNGCLLCVTGGCWAIISGIPLFDVKEDNQNNIYGFCPCCGNTYPVLKPEPKTFIDNLQNTHDRFSHVVNQAKGFVGNIQNNNGNNNNNNYNNNNYNNNNGNFNNNNYNNNNNNFNNNGGDFNNNN